MASKKRYLTGSRLLLGLVIILGSGLSSCTFFAPKEETGKATSSVQQQYVAPTQAKKEVKLPTATLEKKQATMTQPAIEPTGPQPETPPAEAATPTAGQVTAAAGCPIILLEGTPGAGGITASSSRTWVETIEGLQSSQAAPITIPVSDQVAGLCATDGKVHLYLGWQDASHLTDRGEVAVNEAITLIQNGGGQPAIAIP